MSPKELSVGVSSDWSEKLDWGMQGKPLLLCHILLSGPRLNLWILVAGFKSSRLSRNVKAIRYHVLSAVRLAPLRSSAGLRLGLPVSGVGRIHPGTNSQRAACAGWSGHHPVGRTWRCPGARAAYARDRVHRAAAGAVLSADLFHGRRQQRAIY